MEEEAGPRGGRNVLDPSAQEFYPTTQFAVAPEPSLYLPYPPPQPPAPNPTSSVYEQLPALMTQHEAQEYARRARAVAADGAPRRAVVLSMVPRHVGEEAVRKDMEAFGGVRAVDAGALRGEGVVTVHFYDLRSALAAVTEVREQHVLQQSRLAQQYAGWMVSPPAPAPWEWPEHNIPAGGAFFLPAPHQMLMSGGARGLIAGQVVWAQFAAKEMEGPNQGILTVFNSDSVSSADLANAFQAFGAVKEVIEIQARQRYKTVEFYDTRDASTALAQLNGRDINGHRLVVEFARTSSQPTSSSSHGKKCDYFPLPPRLLRGTHRGQATGSSSSSSKSDSKRSSTGKTSRNNNNGSNNKNSGGGGNSGRNKNKGSRYASSSSAAASTKQPQQVGSSSRKGWKHHSKHSGEARFLFPEELGDQSTELLIPTSGRDSRTTVMIKNIPNKYSQKLLLNMLDNHCIHCNEKIGEGEGEEPMSAYDFVYLPIDFNNKCNVGYGFVNLTSPEAAWRLYKAFHMQPWEVFNSRKICQVTYARLQGLEALKEHFRNSKFACDNDEYMPVVFSPPRDGKQLTDPMPIGGRSAAAVGIYGRKTAAEFARMGRRSTESTSAAVEECAASSTTASTHAPSEHADDAGDGDDDGDGDGDVESNEETTTSSQLSEALLCLSYRQE